MTSIQPLLQKASLAMQQNNLAEASRIANVLAAQVPNHPDVLHLQALIAKGQGNLAASKQLFERGIQAQASNPIIWSNYANLLKQLNLIEQAEAGYKNAVKILPSHLDAYINWALMLSQQGKYSRAIEILVDAKKSVGEHPRLISTFGQIYLNHEHFDLALKQFEQVLTLNPNDLNAKHAMGLCYRNLEQPAKAVNCFEQVLDKVPDHPVAHFTKGCALYDQGDLEGAELSLKRSIAISPQYIEAHEALNKLYWEYDKNDKFLVSFEEAIRQQPKSAPLRHAYASHLLMSKQVDKAQEVISSALKELGNIPQLQHALGVISLNNKEIDQALPLLTAAEKGEATSTRFKIDLANAYIRQGDYHNALPLLDAAQLIAPLNQEIWAYKGTTWRLLGDERYLWLTNPDLFIDAQILETPAGYANIEDFMAQLSEYLQTLHNSVKQPLDQSVQGGSQTVGRLFSNQHQLVKDYRTVLTKRVHAYLNRLPADNSHPFLNRNNKAFFFAGSWSVLLRENGYHTNHVHPEGWLSGPTYISIPAHMSATDTRKSGWVKFGETSLQLGDKEQISKELCPEVGMSVLFPSYTWHGTHKLQERSERMTAPCDISPAN